MAEGFLREMAGDEFEVFSAGVNPTEVNPLAVRVMSQAGVDISKQSSKSVREFLGQEFDYVITVCSKAKDQCPIFPGQSRSIHWELDDPAQANGPEEKRIKVFRDTRDDIKARITDFLAVKK